LIDEDFEDATWLPTGWTGSSVDHYQGATYNHTQSGERSAKLNDNNDYLITPILTNPETMTFWYLTTNDQETIVESSTDTISWSHVTGSPFNPTDTTFIKKEVDLSGYDEDIYVRWKRWKQGGPGDLYVDDVLVTSVGTMDSTPPCAISNLTALPGSSDGQVDLKWMAPGDDGTTGGNASSYEIKYATYEITLEKYSAVSDIYPLRRRELPVMNSSLPAYLFRMV